MALNINLTGIRTMLKLWKATQRWNHIQCYSVCLMGPRHISQPPVVGRCSAAARTHSRMGLQATRRRVYTQGVHHTDRAEMRAGHSMYLYLGIRVEGHVISVKLLPLNSNKKHCYVDITIVTQLRETLGLYD